MYNGNARRSAAAFEILNLRCCGIRTEHAKTPVLEIAGEHHHPRLIEILHAGGADTDADGPRPVFNTGTVRDVTMDFRQHAGKPIRDVEKTQIARIDPQLRNAGIRRGTPFSSTGMTEAEAVQHNLLRRV